MDYYVLPKNIPTIRFAHSYTSKKLHFDHQPRKDFLEITFTERGRFVRTEENGTTHLIPSESIMASTFTSPFSINSDEPHRHCTIGINMKYDLVDKDTAGAIPLYDVIASEDFVIKVGKIIHSCVNDFLLSRDNSFLGTSYIFQLFAQYEEFHKENTLLTNSPNIKPSATQYVKQIKNYILLHIREKITIDDIADAVNLSSGYISNIFKQVCGVSIIRYVNEMKLQLIQDLTLNTSTTLAEACYMIGIDDPYYVSRMFKKYYGTSLRNIKYAKYKLDNN